MDVISKEGHALLEELIRVGIDGQSRSFKKIPRRRMMQGNINKLFDVNVRLERSDCTVCCTAVAKIMGGRLCRVHRRYPPPPTPSHLTLHPPAPRLLALQQQPGLHVHTYTHTPQCAYLKDGYGDYIWPEDWMIKCVCNPPATYYVVEKEKEVESIDPTEDLRYAGESLVIITECPEDVYHKDLRAWIRCGLADEDRWERGGAYVLYVWNLGVRVVHAGHGRACARVWFECACCVCAVCNTCKLTILY